MVLFRQDNVWVRSHDGNEFGRALFHRHYSYRPRADGSHSKLFVGPGEKMILLTQNNDALFVWRKYITDDGQTGVNCAVFRNESDMLSSFLIKQAMEHAFLRWPGERLYTYVDAKKIRGSNPGYCFQRAGWRKCGATAVRKLIILEYAAGE